MTTRPVWTKNGLRLDIEVDKRPLPRTSQVWPIPAFGSGTSALIALTLGTDPVTGRNAIQVAIPELSALIEDQAWLLEHAVDTGPWSLVARLAGKAEIYMLTSPAENATHRFRLVLREWKRPRWQTYPEVSIWVPFSGGPSDISVTPVTPSSLTLTITN